MKKIKTLSYLLTPDAMFDKFYDITPDFLLSKGITALLIDIDNTLAPYEEALPNNRIIEYFKSLANAGIKATLVSNNDQARVTLFNSSLSLPAYANCKKPSTKMLRFAMEQMGSTTENTAAIGDQLLTDALAAHRLGIPAYIVPPIRDKKNLFFRFKRWLEKPYVRKYKKLKALENK